MRPSKTALFCYSLGIVFLIIGVVFTGIASSVGSKNLDFMTFSMVILCAFWIIGLQYDLYSKKVL